jgi:hypothetical protein
MIIEATTVADAGRPAARAAARMMATRARATISDVLQVLESAGDVEGAASARTAGEAITGLIAATYDGKARTFACKR